VVATGARLVHLLRSSGITEAMSASAAARLARDMVRFHLRGAQAIIHLQALVDPLRPAVVDERVRLNYGELEARINRLTHGLVALGVSPGVPMGAFLHNGHEYLELHAALSSVGGTLVQIGHRLKAPEVAHILENSQARALLFDARLTDVVDEVLGLPGVRLQRERCVVAGQARGFRSYEELVRAGDASQPAHVVGGGYGGNMIYTSGTTGRVKGAARDMRRFGYAPIISFLSRFPVRRDERHLVVCPVYHSSGLFFVSVIMALGGCLVLRDHFDAEEVLATIERERISSAMMVPTMYARLMALSDEQLRAYDLSSLRWLMSGAAPLPTELARRIEDRIGPILYNFYGATETGLVTMAGPGEHTARPGTIGRRLGGNEVRLLDEAGRPVADGEVGELYVRNSMMMEGYHRNAEATRAASRDGFLSVGDLASRDADGYYYLADRKADMVISGGVNIYPWEIEQRLLEHRAVDDAAVVGVPDPEWGESLVAFIVPRAGAAPTHELEGALQAHVAERLADYKKPRRVLFVEALPRNATGKLLKRELRARAAAALANAAS
jgi:fatty-acyl-CoA synthase